MQLCFQHNSSNKNKTVLTCQFVIECLILFTLSIVSVLPTLWGTFIFDDGEAIVKNEDVISAADKSNISQIFRHDFWGVRLTHPQSHKSYRPLTTLSYRFDWSIWGENPFPFHLFNLLIHGVNCTLVYLFLIKCTAISKKVPASSPIKVVNKKIRNLQAAAASNNGATAHHHTNAKVNKFNTATNNKSANNGSLLNNHNFYFYYWKNNSCFWASILFAVHPIHVEPLGSLVGRADLLSSFVFLLSFILIAEVPSTRTAAQLILAAIIGSLFKENAVVIIVLYIGIHLLKQKSLKKVKTSHLFFHGLTLAFVVIFIKWRLWFQNGSPIFQPFDNPAVFAGNKFTKISSIVYIWVLNIFLLACPIWLCYDWSMGCVSLIESPFDLRFILLLAFIGTSIVFLRKVLQSKIITISLLISATTFLPSSNLLFTVGFVIAERNLYLVSIGFCLLIGHLFVRKKLLRLLAFITILFFARSVQRSVEWTSQDKLFHTGLQVCPNNAKIHYNLGTIFGEAGNVTLAVNSYKKAIELRADYYQSMNNLGNILRTVGALDEAELWLRRAVLTKDDFAPAWMNLGIVLSHTNYTEALHCYIRALQLRKHYPDCEYNLGNLYLDMDSLDLAFQSWKRATILKPTHTQAWINIVVLLDQQNKLLEAKEFGMNASKILKHDDTLQFLLGNIAGKLKDYEAAKNHFETAIRFCEEKEKPIPAKYWSNLGVLHHRCGKKSEAVKCYEEALRLDSTLDSTRKNLAMLTTQL